MEIARTWIYLVGVWALVGMMILSIVLGHRKFKIQNRWQEIRAKTDKEILKRLEYLTDMVTQDAQLNMHIGQALLKPSEPREEHKAKQGQVFKPDTVLVSVGDGERRFPAQGFIDMSQAADSGIDGVADTMTGRGGVLTECIQCGKEHRVQAMFCCDECEAAFDNEEDCADVYHADKDHFPPYGTQSSEPPKK